MNRLDIGRILSMEENIMNAKPAKFSSLAIGARFWTWYCADESPIECVKVSESIYSEGFSLIWHSIPDKDWFVFVR